MNTCYQLCLKHAVFISFTCKRSSLKKKKKDKACFFSLWLLLIVTTLSIYCLQFFLSIMLWHFILTMTWKSIRLTRINATISRHDVLQPSEKSYVIVDDRVCLDLVLACHLFSTKVKRFVLQNFHIYAFTFYQRMSKLDVYFLNHLLWCISATSVARWSIPRITCLLSSLVRARVSVLDASVLSLRYAAPSLHFSIRDGISPANPGILFTAYPATDVHLFTLLKLKEASGVVLGNVCEVYATAPLSFLWGNISTPPAAVFPMSRCVVWG